MEPTLRSQVQFLLNPSLIENISLLEPSLHLCDRLRVPRVLIRHWVQKCISDSDPLVQRVRVEY